MSDEEGAGLQKLTFADLGSGVPGQSTSLNNDAASARRIEELYDEMQQLDNEHLEKFKSQREQIESLLVDLKHKRDEALNQEQLAVVRACVERMDGLNSELVQLQTKIADLEHRQAQISTSALAQRQQAEANNNNNNNNSHSQNQGRDMDEIHHDARRGYRGSRSVGPGYYGRSPQPHARQDQMSHSVHMGDLMLQQPTSFHNNESSLNSSYGYQTQRDHHQADEESRRNAVLQSSSAAMLSAPRFPIPKQAQVPRAPIQPYARFTSEGTGVPRTPNFRTPDDRSVVATDDDGRWRMLQKKIPYSSAPVASVDHAAQERTLERMQATQHNLDSVLSASHRADGSRHDLTASLAELSAASTRSHRQHRSFSSAAEAMAEYDAASGHVAALATVESPRKTRKLAEQNLALQPRVHYVPDLEDGRGSSRGNWFYGHTQRLQLHTDLADNPTAQAVPVPAQKDRRDYWLLKSCARATSPNVGPGRYAKPVAKSRWAKLARPRPAPAPNGRITVRRKAAPWQAEWRPGADNWVDNGLYYSAAFVPSPEQIYGASRSLRHSR